MLMWFLRLCSFSLLLLSLLQIEYFLLILQVYWLFFQLNFYFTSYIFQLWVCIWFFPMLCISLLTFFIHCIIFIMLLLLSRFSGVRPCATSEMAAHQAPPSLGFSRQEHWSGLPFPSPNNCLRWLLLSVFLFPCLMFSWQLLNKDDRLLW